MEIKVCRSTELSQQEWSSYTMGFNEVFNKSYTVSGFKDKYLTAYKGYACHAILLSDEGNAVGGVTVIPCYYNSNKDRIVVGLACDVFIRQDYRVDPLMLRRMYKKLVPLLKEEGILAVIAVPNATAYPYWKNVVKWKDVGYIRYWALPVNAGKILGKTGFIGGVLNFGSKIYCAIVCFVSMLLSLIDFKEKCYKYNICKDDPYYTNKFVNESYQKGDEVIYKLENEDGVKTGYILKAESNGCRSSRSLYKCVSKILENNADIIIYVGKLGFFQTLLIRVPQKFEPKLLPFTCDLLSDDLQYADMLDMDNWDFGLQNYDVR